MGGSLIVLWGYFPYKIQNVSFLVLGDCRQQQRRMTDGNFVLLKSCYLFVKLETKQRKKSFFPTRNQYFPHISILASKNAIICNGKSYFKINQQKGLIFWFESLLVGLKSFKFKILPKNMTKFLEKEEGLLQY
jgi:hypothetical protein